MTVFLRPELPPYSECRPPYSPAGTYGKNNVTPEVIRILSDRLDSKDKVIILKESAEATDWVYALIKKVCQKM